MQDYLKRVDPNLALNIYTAVTNPITLEGRLKLCKGALSHKDYSAAVARAGVPAFIVQSTEDILVNAANVDPFLSDRSVSHLWSHQLHLHAPVDGSSLGKKAYDLIFSALGRGDAAFVMWVAAGHEIRQEVKRPLHDLLDVLAFPSPAHFGCGSGSAEAPPMLRLMPSDTVLSEARAADQAAKEEASDSKAAKPKAGSKETDVLGPAKMPPKTSSAPEVPPVDDVSRQVLNKQQQQKPTAAETGKPPAVVVGPSKTPREPDSPKKPQPVSQETQPLEQTQPAEQPKTPTRPAHSSTPVHQPPPPQPPTDKAKAFLAMASQTDELDVTVQARPSSAPSNVMDK